MQGKNENETDSERAASTIAVMLSCCLCFINTWQIRWFKQVFVVFSPINVFTFFSFLFDDILFGIFYQTLKISQATVKNSLRTYSMTTD
jgi:hypothetical protein